MKNKTALTTVAILLTGLTLTACGTETQTPNQETVATETVKEETGVTPEQSAAPETEPLANEEPSTLNRELEGATLAPVTVKVGETVNIELNPKWGKEPLYVVEIDDSTIAATTPEPSKYSKGTVEIVALNPGVTRVGVALTDKEASQTENKKALSPYIGYTITVTE